MNKYLVNKNSILFTLVGAVLAPHLDKYNIKLSQDDYIQIALGLVAAYHVVSPYAARIFDKYFPPTPEPNSTQGK